MGSAFQPWIVLGGSAWLVAMTNMTNDPVTWQTATDAAPAVAAG